MRPTSAPGVIDNLDRVVASEDLEALSDILLDMVVLDMLESREGGRTSGKLAVDGDWSLDGGTDTTTGEDIEVPPGLLSTAPGFDTGELVGRDEASWVGSLTPPTEARKRL